MKLYAGCRLDIHRKCLITFKVWWSGQDLCFFIFTSQFWLLALIMDTDHFLSVSNCSKMPKCSDPIFKWIRTDFCCWCTIDSCNLTYNGLLPFCPPCCPPCILSDFIIFFVRLAVSCRLHKSNDKHLLH